MVVAEIASVVRRARFTAGSLSDEPGFHVSFNGQL
jgi:hypothetical protein